MVLDILGFFDLLLSYDSIKYNLGCTQRQELLSSLDSIFKRKTACRILFELVARRAVTGRVLIHDLEVPEATFYSSIRWLVQNDYAVKVAPLGRGGRGRKATIYAIPSYIPEDVAAATKEDRFIGTPGYAEVERIAEAVLGKYLNQVQSDRYEGLIDRTRLYEVMKKECKGFRWFDFKLDVERLLRQRGVKVA